MLRYGNVRKTDAALVEPVVAGLLARISVGLLPACASLDDDAADMMRHRIDGVHAALTTLNRPDWLAVWRDALVKVGDAEIQRLVAGRAHRLLLDTASAVSDAAADRLSLSLSRGNDPAKASAWLEGFLSGSGLVLVHDERLLGMIDRWLTGLTRDAFEQICPIARRTFSTFEKAERRQIGEKIKGATAADGTAASTATDDYDPVRGAVVEPIPPYDSRRSDDMTAFDSKERLERWRLLLGGQEADGTGFALTGRALAMDRAMAALYDGAGERGASLSASAPNAVRWLGDIREYFPSSVVRVMQKDAIERLGMEQLLLEPEMLSALEPDLNLVITLMALSGVIPQRAKATARLVVRRVVQDLLRRLAAPMRQAVIGALNRSTRNTRPRHNEIDWNRTIRANLKHYQPDYGVIVPEKRIGFGRRRNELKTVVVCIDQSGSMGQSVVYSGIFGAVLASIPALRTHVVVFDTSIADLTEHMSDPVDVLMGIQLGGGTDINQALRYCQTLITKPTDTIFVLITDLYEGGRSRGDAQACRRDRRLRRALRDAARARRRRRSFIRRAERGGVGGHGHPQLRLHTGSVPRSDGRSDPGPRSESMGRRAGHDRQPRERGRAEGVSRHSNSPALTNARSHTKVRMR